MGLTYTHTCSVTKSHPTLYNPMDCSMPGLPVHHQLPEFTKTHVHWVGDAIQPSHSLLHPSPSAFNLFQHQGLFSTYTQFSRSVMSNSLRPHESQHARPPYPSPTPGIYPNPCPLSRGYHPTISSSVIPFFSCPQSLPASGSFPMSQFFTWGGQSIGVSASASVLPMNTEDWSPSGRTGWIALQSKGLSRVSSNTTVQKHQFFGTQLYSQSNSHIHTWPLEKP